MLSEGDFQSTSSTTTAITPPSVNHPCIEQSELQPSSHGPPLYESSSVQYPSLTPNDDPQIPITWPPDGALSLDWILCLMKAFDWSSRNLPPSSFPSVLPVPVFDSLILCASKILHKEPNCVIIDDCSADSTVVVVGDVHGQLHDVLFLLREAGFPAENRFFVFNGDYVDRGAWGLETFVMLLAWKILLPHRVYLLRGNHESKYCTSVYGFEKEVMTKYGDQGKHVYRKCLGCFEGLPLTSIIAGRVYTAHGGLFRSIPATPSKRYKGKKKNRKISKTSDDSCLALGSLEELSKARRSVLDPPWEGANLIPGDVLWSDPSMKAGLSPNKERGIGLLWGPDCTELFLKRLHLKLVIRSHEGPDAREKRPGLAGMNEGYTIDHTVESGKLITLFSAPDYPQFQTDRDTDRPPSPLFFLPPIDIEQTSRRTDEQTQTNSRTPKPLCRFDFNHLPLQSISIDFKLEHPRRPPPSSRRSSLTSIGLQQLIFKASEERHKNKGAYIVLEPPNFDSPVFRTFEAVLPRPKANPYYDFEEVIDSDEELDLVSMVSAPEEVLSPSVT